MNEQPAMPGHTVALHLDGAASVLRFERRLAHPPAKVWKAITDPAEMAHWFPAEVRTELQPGARMEFTFPDDAPVDSGGDGEILEFDPPKVYAFRWNNDVLRFELLPDGSDGSGCLLVFSHTLGGGGLGRLGAGRDAVGWDVCLDALQARLAGDAAEQPTDWLERMEHYIRRFGLDEGDIRNTPDGYTVHFARDLVWKPVDQVWALLTGDAEPRAGDAPPLQATNGYVPAGPVTAVDAPRLLEYEWHHDGAPAGLVRWEVVHDPLLGTRVELTHTLPARLTELRATALAAWHVHLELFFASSHGDIRCPWPQQRIDELQQHYHEQLRSS